VRIDQQAIPYESRMSLWARREHEAVAMDRRAAEIVLECGLDIPSRAELSAATAPGDTRKLRGIPAVGPGVPGAIRGTRPDRALM